MRHHRIDVKFEGSYDGFIMRFACNGKTRKSTYMFWRFSKTPPADAALT